MQMGGDLGAVSSHSLYGEIKVYLQHVKNGRKWYLLTEMTLEIFGKTKMTRLKTFKVPGN